MVYPKCCVKGCKKKAVGERKHWQGFFYGQKQGMVVVRYPVCHVHDMTAHLPEGLEVDRKALLRNNPGLKEFLS
jgi:hypothetical protein